MSGDRPDPSANRSTTRFRLDRSGLLWSIAVAVAFGLGTAAGAYVLARSAAPPSGGEETTTYTVELGSLGRTISFPAVGRWEIVEEVFAPGGGTVTELVHEAGPVEAGDVIIRLDERPMVIVAGEVPAFRPLDVGTRGRDVAALNAFLADRGYDVDPESATFDSATRSAVTDWQEDLDMQPTGMVELGDILFLARDQLGGPAFRIAPGVNVGASLSAGTPFLQQLASSPTVSVEFGAMTPDELRPGITGTLAFPTGETVPVGLGEITLDEGRSILELTAPDGGSVCAPSECSRLVDAQSDVRLTVEFTLVPETEGPILPAAAIQTGADGDPFVYLADGRRINVEIIVVSGGLVVVDGVEEGAEVALP